MNLGTQPRLVSRGRAGLLLAAGLHAGLCAAPAVARSGQWLSPSDVLRAPASFVGRDVRVRGRVHVVRSDTLGPCDPAAVDCPPSSPTLQLVTEGVTPAPATALDLYREGEAELEPVSCTTLATHRLDCGRFVPDTVMVVSGRIVERRIPVQQVGTPSGGVRVIRSRTVHGLRVRQE